MDNDLRIAVNFVSSYEICFFFPIVLYYNLAGHGSSQDSPADQSFLSVSPTFPGGKEMNFIPSRLIPSHILGR